MFELENSLALWQALSLSRAHHQLAENSSVFHCFADWSSTSSSSSSSSKFCSVVSSCIHIQRRKPVIIYGVYSRTDFGIRKLGGLCSRVCVRGDLIADLFPGIAGEHRYPCLDRSRLDRSGGSFPSEWSPTRLPSQAARRGVPQQERHGQQWSSVLCETVRECW